MAEASWFAGRLRELREGAGLTQQQLAEKAGLTRAGVAQLEIGRRKPAWETVLAVAQALGVSCEAFTVSPADVERPGPGRPRKAPPEGAGQQAKRPRGRPRKAPGAGQAGRSSGEGGQQPSGQKRAGKGRRRAAGGGAAGG